MNSSVGRNTMGESLLTDKIQAILFTEQDGFAVTADDFATLRKSYFENGEKTARLHRAGIMKGLSGRVVGKMTTHNFFWKKTVGHVDIEEAFSTRGGYVLVKRNFDSVITAKIHFNKDHTWMKSEYFDMGYQNPNQPASVLLKPAENLHGINRFDYQQERQKYAITLLYPTPYPQQPPQQSILNARFGDPQVITFSARGSFSYCPDQAQAEHRKQALAELEKGTVMLMPAWEVREGALQAPPPADEALIRFSGLDKLAQLPPDSAPAQPEAPGPEAKAEMPAEIKPTEPVATTEKRMPHAGSIPIETSVPGMQDAEKAKAVPGPDKKAETAPEPVAKMDTVPEMHEPAQANALTIAKITAVLDAAGMAPAAEAAVPARSDMPKETAAQEAAFPENATTFKEPAIEKNKSAAGEEIEIAAILMAAKALTDEDMLETAAETTLPTEPLSPNSARLGLPEDDENDEFLSAIRRVLEKDWEVSLPEMLSEKAKLQSREEATPPLEIHPQPQDRQIRVSQPDGKTVYQGGYNQGKRDGFGTYYYKDGTLCHAGFWKNDMRDGLGVSFRHADQALHISNWQENKPIGFTSLFDKHGNFKFGGKIVKGQKTGVGISYNNHDGTVFVGKWDNGKPTGYGSAFDEDGNLLYTGMWKNGKRNGTGTAFDRHGDVVFSGEWKDDHEYNGILYKKPRQETGLAHEEQQNTDEQE